MANFWQIDMNYRVMLYSMHSVPSLVAKCITWHLICLHSPPDTVFITHNRLCVFTLTKAIPIRQVIKCYLFIIP